MAFRVGDEIAKLQSEKRRSGLMARLVGLAWDKFWSPFEWLAWRLWGRRRAIKRFQQLAGLGPFASQETGPKFDSPEKVGYIDYPKESIPAPDSTDVN